DPSRDKRDDSMTTLRTPPPPRPSATRTPTIADLLERLGNIPPGRVLFQPQPRLAAVAAGIALHAHAGRLCAVIDGVLVEKAMGFRESLLAGLLIQVLRDFVGPRNLGLVSGEAGMLRLLVGQVRIPDVAFLSWDRIPGRRVPTEPVPHLVPD